MSDSAMHADPLLLLAEAICDGTASEQDLVQVDAMMLADPDARRRYLDYCQLHFALQLQLRAQSAGQRARHRMNVASAVPISDEAHDEEERTSSAIPLDFLGTTVHGAVGYFSSGWPVAYLVATVIVGIGLLVGLITHVSTPVEVAHQAVPLPSPRSCQSSFVGRITGMVDCQWSDPRTAVPGPVAVPLGRKYALSSGLLEITYDTGATVILQGPVAYEVTSKDGGYLSVGKLTAKVEKKEERRTKNEELSASRSSFLIPHSYFAVRTPTAVVTDLGTEFGVEVAKSGETTSHVFRGSVEVQAVGVDGNTEGAARVLHEHESVRVTKSDGKCVIAADASVPPAAFVQTLPKQAIKTFDLVDVVAGGDGFSGRRGQGINPTNGEILKTMPERESDANVIGDRIYHRVPSLPLVDGVFIPNGIAGPVQTDSVGHRFDFPATDNRAGGPVWAGGPIPSPVDRPCTVPTQLGNIDYATPGHGLLFMHANKAITFDLDAIRNANPASKLVRFRAMGGNLKEGDTVIADLWVLVDGEARFRRRQINASHGPFSIIVPLGENDRFLTLAATDGGNGFYADWILFGDPRLELTEKVEEGRTTNKPTAP